MNRQAGDTLTVQSSRIAICTTRFNIQKPCIPHPQGIYAFYTILKTNSDYIPAQSEPTVFIIYKRVVYFRTR